MGFVSWIWGGLKSLPGLLLPFLAKAPGAGLKNRWVRLGLHLLLLTAVLVGLGYVNYLLDLEKVLRAPWPVLRKVWLPLLFVLMYALGWLGWWLYRLLQPEEKNSAFPDIDAAWKEIQQALDNAGLGLSEAPLFLVLGKPAGAEESLFAAANMPFQVRNVPRKPAAPLHVFAGRDGIFLTCAGASLLGRQAALLTDEEETSVPEKLEAVGVGAAPPAAPHGKGHTLHWRALPAVDTATHPRLDPTATLTTAATAGQRRRQLLQSAEETATLTARLKHVCQLIVAARRPYCPLNGILVLVPWAALDSDADAQLHGRVCQRDLETVREALQVQCPVFTLVCDLESAPGFPDLIERLPESQRSQRLGRGFPLVPDLDPTALPTMMNAGIGWTCQTLVPNLIYRLFRLPGSEERRGSETLDGNIRLYQLVQEMRDRQHRLGGILKRGILRESAATSLFGGCYLAATGRDSRSEQAFVAGVFPLLLDNQNFVSWTPTALSENSSYQRWAGFGYAGLAAVAVVLVSATYFFWPGR